MLYIVNKSQAAHINYRYHALCKDPSLFSLNKNKFFIYFHHIFLVFCHYSHKLQYMFSICCVLLHKNLTSFKSFSLQCMFSIFHELTHNNKAILKVFYYFIIRAYLFFYLLLLLLFCFFYIL